MQRSTDDRRVAPEWHDALTSHEAVARWLDDATAWQMESLQIHGTCQPPSADMFEQTDPLSETKLSNGGMVTVHSLCKASHYNGRHGTLMAYDDDAGRWTVKLSLDATIKVQPDNLRALEAHHPLLLTPTALDDPTNLWCLPPGPLWWSNAMLDLQNDFHSVLAEVERAGVTGGLTFQPPQQVTRRKRSG